MEYKKESVFTMIRSRILLNTLGALLVFLPLVVIPACIAFRSIDYPDLDVFPIFCVLGVGLTGAIILFELRQQTVSIKLGETGFTVKRWGSRAVYYPYNAIMSYNERLQADRSSTYNELTLYMPTNWFVIRSNVYDAYAYLKTALTRFGQSVAYHPVITRTERTQTRWFLVGVSLLIIASIAFGFAAHNPANKKTAPLSAFSTVIDEVRVSKAKGNFKGLSFRLHRWPDLCFFASRQDFDQDIQPMYQRIQPNRPVTLLLREGDIQMKLLKTEPLTFGDKYIDYERVDVFGIRQGTDVNLSTTQPVYEPTRTNPYQRLLFFGVLLVFCGTCWTLMEQQRLPH